MESEKFISDDESRLEKIFILVLQDIILAENEVSSSEDMSKQLKFKKVASILRDYSNDLVGAKKMEGDEEGIILRLIAEAYDMVGERNLDNMQEALDLLLTNTSIPIIFRRLIEDLKSDSLGTRLS